MPGIEPPSRIKRTGAPHSASTASTSAPHAASCRDPSHQSAQWKTCTSTVLDERMR